VLHYIGLEGLARDKHFSLYGVQNTTPGVYFRELTPERYPMWVISALTSIKLGCKGLPGTNTSVACKINILLL